MRASLCLLVGASFACSASEKVDFSREIRPILNTNCLPCHGGVKKSGEVSFLFRDEALSTGKSGKRTIVPGNPEESEMLVRILSDDPEEVMPQPEHGPPLSESQADLIRRWIEEGAEWSNHWSFEKPERHRPPEVSDQSWVKNAIDPFILAKLDELALKPAPPATADRLLRRLFLDLTGQPPGLDDLDAFAPAYEANPDEAVARVVDDLLSRPSFGEKWATSWLDVARYADSEGLGADRRWTAWPYRDWVIRSLNNDLPYDQFLLKQLAGDLLPEPTLDDLIATNYNRLTQQNAEGGTDNEEFRVMAVMDRINTTWKGLQGITFECVQCHSHPYEPIRQNEYYEFMGFFNNSRDLDHNSHFPTLPVPANRDDFPAQARHRATYRRLHSQLQNQARDIINSTSWLKVNEMTVASERVGSESRERDGYLEFLTKGTIPNGITFKLEIPKPGTIQQLTAFRVHTLPLDPAKAAHTPELGAVLSRITLKVRLPDADNPVEVPLARVIGDDDFPIWDPNDSLRNGGSGWGAHTHQYHPRSCVVLLENPLDLPDGATLLLELRHNAAAPTGPMATKRGRLELTDSTAFQDWLAKEETQKTMRDRDAAGDAYEKGGEAKLAIMDRIQPGLRRETRTFKRGNWLEKGDENHLADTPASLAPLNPRNPGDPDRLDLARWIVSKDNPFTSRVHVARIWGQIFGRSLVETLEDFGSSGIPPSHPKLLDDLAVRFQGEMNYSVKSLIREIVLSATYRQSARADSLSREKDPRNIYLSRGPRNRLSAESVRDHHLVVSGLANPTLYGPPVRPPIPDGVWKPFNDGPWNAAPVGDPSRYCRAIYTYWKRSIPYPTFGAFDAPTRETCSSRRLVSNTPLAALATLNDEAFAEMARGLARRMDQEGGESLPEKLTAGFRLATSLRPSARQLEILTSLFEDTVEDFQTNPADYQGLAETADEAALTVVASTLLNMDDALTK